MLDLIVSFSHYVYLLQGIHSRTFCWRTQTNFRLYWQKLSFRQLAWGDFHAHLLASLTLISMKKITRGLPGEKNIPFCPARTGINFPSFQLARRSFRFPSQLISQCNFPSYNRSNSAWRARIFSSGFVGYSWLIQGQILTWISFSFVQKHFPG